jgi:hypothetical protein
VARSALRRLSDCACLEHTRDSDDIDQWLSDVTKQLDYRAAGIEQ